MQTFDKKDPTRTGDDQPGRHKNHSRSKAGVPSRAPTCKEGDESISTPTSADSVDGLLHILAPELGVHVVLTHLVVAKLDRGVNYKRYRM